jgi:hypothetical protein
MGVRKMSSSRVQVCVTISPALKQRMAEALDKENQKNPLNQQTLSEWIRGSILYRLNTIEKLRDKRKNKKVLCEWCGASTLFSEKHSSWKNLEGKWEHSCKDCSRARAREINNPK